MNRVKNLMTNVYASALLVFLLVLVVNEFYPENDFLSGLRVESAGMVITVIFLGFIIESKNKTRLAKLNNLKTKNLVFSISFTLVSIANVLGNKVSIEDIKEEITPAEFRRKTVEYLNSPAALKYFSNLGRFKIENVSKLKKFEKMVEGRRKAVKDALNDISPYPNPELQARLQGEQVQSMAFFKVRYEMLKGILVDIPKDNPQYRTKDSIKEFEKIWDFISKDNDSPISDDFVKNAITKLLEDYAWILEKVEKNQHIYGL